MADPTAVVSFGDQIGTSMIVVWLLEKAKQANWLPWVTSHGGAVNRLLSVVLGAAAAAGIIWTFDPAGGVLTVQGLTIANALSVLWIILKQVAYQEGIYRGLVKPAAVVEAAKVAAVKDKAAVISAVDGQ